jgi:hypothetical protein
MLGLAAMAGADLAPTVPLPTFLLYAAIGGLALVALVVAAAVVSLTVAQWVLRQGGTDPQWFWFGSEPRGLRDLRLQAKALAQQQQQVHGEP